VLADDALQPQAAGVLEDERTIVVLQVLVELDAARRAR
jgi:hypothetical protein